MRECTICKELESNSNNFMSYGWQQMSYWEKQLKEHQKTCEVFQERQQMIEIYQNAEDEYYVRLSDPDRSGL